MTFESTLQWTRPPMFHALERGIHGYFPFRPPARPGRSIPRRHRGSRWPQPQSAQADLAAMVDLAEQFTDEGVDAALPRLVRLGARYLRRSLQQRSGRRLSPPLRRQITRSTAQAARTLVRQHGRAGVRAFPRVMQRVRRQAVQRQVPARQIPRAIQRAAAPASTAPPPCAPPLVPAHQNPLCQGAPITHGAAHHRARIRRVVDSMCRQGWCDIRVNRRQVVQGGTTRNRPDVSGIHPRTGRRIHVEIDTRPDSSRRHEGTVVGRDRSATSTYVVIDPQTGRIRQGRTYKPGRGTTRPRTR